MELRGLHLKGFTALLISILIASCSHFESEPDPTEEPATEILEIRVAPNPVSAGEVTTITCVTSDSLSNDLTFRWSRPGQDTSTTVNYIEWRAPSEEGTYSFTASVFGRGRPADRQFTVEVVP